MKAISLWNPWAHAMALGIKRNETRSWKTDYRGDLVICSSKRKLDATGLEVAAAYNIPPEDMVYGYALCIVEVIEMARTEDFMLYADQCKLPLRVITGEEYDMGDYSPGRWAWITGNLRRFTRPLPVIGHQGMWDMSDDVALVETTNNEPRTTNH